ncbi:MAG TPA: SAM-dependent chlorinase/fluorinase [Candidatus Acidoferrales bacterium]|nr:SAM-dependent chlorinase/fluorinase [Candidatus Acidoferrales bacterium]
MRILSLLTDFDVKDPFVAEMKAVIFSICPEPPTIIDITHEVERFNVRTGAFILAGAAPHFPEGTIHVAVVDPGVGSERRAILVETKHSLYVGPDNGLLIPAASREGILHVYELTNRSLMSDHISSTFHGRDIFAPVAAHVATGLKPETVGEEITNFVQLSFPEPSFNHRGVRCEVLHVDSFGNIITNVRPEKIEKLKLNDKKKLRIRGKQFPLRLVRTFSDLRGTEFGLLAGSQGFFEVACRQESAASRLRVRSGDVLRVEDA